MFAKAENEHKRTSSKQCHLDHQNMRIKCRMLLESNIKYQLQSDWHEITQKDDNCESEIQSLGYRKQE